MMSIAWQKERRMEPFALETLRPVDHQRVAHAAAVGVLLVPLERRVADLRPAPGNVGMTVRTANVVEPFHGLVDVLHHAVEPLHLIEDTGRSAFLACAVVRHDDEDGIVELTEFVEERHHPADLRIRVVELRGERLLQTRGESLFVRAELVPRPHARI